MNRLAICVDLRRCGELARLAKHGSAVLVCGFTKSIASPSDMLQRQRRAALRDFVTAAGSRLTASSLRLLLLAIHTVNYSPTKSIHTERAAVSRLYGA